MLPQALKSRPNTQKSPNLVTLVITVNLYFWMWVWSDNEGIKREYISFSISSRCLKLDKILFWTAQMTSKWISFHRKPLVRVFCLQQLDEKWRCIHVGHLGHFLPLLTIWLPTHYAVYSWRGAPDRLSKQAKTRRRKTLVIPRPAWPLVLYQNKLAVCSMVKGVFFWRLLPSNLPTYHPTTLPTYSYLY